MQGVLWFDDWKCIFCLVFVAVLCDWNAFYSITHCNICNLQQRLSCFVSDAPNIFVLLKWLTVGPIYVQSVSIGCIILMWNCPLSTTYNVQYSVRLKNWFISVNSKEIIFPKLDSSSMKSVANHECRLILLLLHKNKTKWSLQWHSKLDRISLIGIAHNCFRNSFWRSIDFES